MNIVRYHDGQRFVAALDAGEGRKYRHLVVITDGGVRVIEAPLNARIEVLGPALKKHARTFLRVGKVFGISKAARQAIEGVARA